MMIAQAPAVTTAPTNIERGTQNAERETPFTVSRVVASLQVLLAARRAARNEEYAYWYTIARGL